MVSIFPRLFSLVIYFCVFVQAPFFWIIVDTNRIDPKQMQFFISSFQTSVFSAEIVVRTTVIWLCMKAFNNWLLSYMTNLIRENIQSKSNKKRWPIIRNIVKEKKTTNIISFCFYEPNSSINFFTFCRFCSNLSNPVFLAQIIKTKTFFLRNGNWPFIASMLTLLLCQCQQ
jgi:hypothetical protein